MFRTRPLDSPRWLRSGLRRTACLVGRSLALCWALASRFAVASEPPTPKVLAPSDNACVRPAEDVYELDSELQRQRDPEWRASRPWVPPPKAPTPVDEPPRPAPSVRIAPTPPRMELSFGSTEKFYNQTLYDPGGFITRRAIPVSTIRPLVDWLFHPDASVWFAVDLPLEPRTELRDEVVVQTYVPPSVLAGIRLSLVSVNILKELWLDLQTDGGLGWTLSRTDENQLFPQVGWRLHLRDQDGFTAYLGGAFEFRLNVGALVYGVGHHF